ncbi:MAG TPA: M12 family metallopeptidase [Polyangiaceae bacterium]
MRRARLWTYLSSVVLAGATTGCAAEVATQEGLPGDEASAETSQELAGLASTFWIPRFHERQTTIPVCFEGGSNWTLAERQSIENLAAVWEQPNGVDFYFHGTCFSDFPGLRVGRISGDTCYAKIGTRGFGVVNGIRLTTAFGARCVRHEFGHALGFTHEQERADRTTCTEGLGQTVPDVYLTPYDDSSIMEYCDPDPDMPSWIDGAGLLAVYGGGEAAISSGKVAIRSARGTYLRYNQGSSTVFSLRDGISSPEQWYIDRGSGGAISYGQVVTIRTKLDNKYVNVQNGALRAGAYAGSASQWQVYNALAPLAAGTIKIHEPIFLRSTTGLYLSRNPSTGAVRLVTPSSSGLSLEDAAWRFHSLLYAPP